MASRSTEPPIGLGVEGRAEWDRLVDRFVPDKHSLLAAYCAAYQRWADAERWLADPEHGPVVTIRDDKGNVKVHGPAPELQVLERALKQMQELMRTLRLTR